VTSEHSPRRTVLSTLRGRRRIAAASVVAAATLSVAGLLVTTMGSATASAPQAYDLTGSSFCNASTGLAAIALNGNLISNPGAEYATARGSVPGGAGTASGSTVTAPDSVLLPDCWAVTSSIAGSAADNEIASAVAASYPGTSGKQNFYGGKSANDAAPAGTTTTASQTIQLSALGSAAGPGGLPFALKATLGGYANQDDNTTLTAAWQNGSGNPVTDSSGHPVVTTLGPVLAVDRGDISSEVPRSAYGTVPAGATQVVITMSFTQPGAGNNDASADNLSLVIGSSAVPPSAQGYDETGTCPSPARVAAGSNLISNPGAEDYTQVAVPYATGGGATGAGTAAAAVAVPDCWVSGDTLPAPDAVIESYPTTPAGYPGVDGERLFFGGTNSSAAVPSPAPGFTSEVQGTTSTATQLIDVSSLSPGGQPFELSGLLGGYSTQGDFAVVTATFEDASGGTLGTAQIGPMTETDRAAAAGYLAYLASQYSAAAPAADSGLLPDQTTGTLPAGTAKVLITIAATAISTGNDSNGVADDLNFTVSPTGAGAHAQSYDLTAGTHGGSANCPAADQVTPALNSNLVENPGAEDYTSDVWFGAPGEDTVDLPDCWVSSSPEPAPQATAESYAQSSASYPPVRTSSRVFWGGTNPSGGIAGVATTATQAISLSSLAAANGGDLGGQPFKLSALLGGYATQDDNAMVSATWQDASGNPLDIASIGPVKAGQRGDVSSLVPQSWYGTVPAGAARVVVTITMTAVSSGNDNNGEADDLNLTIGASTRPSGPVLQTMPYDAAAGGQVNVDPTTGLPLPPAGGLYRPAGVSASDGVVYASNTGDNVVAALRDGQSPLIAGSLEGYGEQGDGAKATSSTLYQPAGTARDAKGDIFIADSGDNVVREITADGVIHRFAGTGAAGSRLSLLGARYSELDHPDGVAVTPAGDVLIADTYNNRVLEVTPSGRITGLAGTSRAGYAGDNGRAALAELDSPAGVTTDAKGNIYIADSSSNVIRRVDARTGIITTVAGDYAAARSSDGLGGFSGDGGQATLARLNDPQGVAVDGAGDLFIADTFNNAIREVTPAGIISTVVSSAGPNGAIPPAGGESSGVAPAASHLSTPQAVAIDASTSTLYIADTHNSAIAEVLGLAQAGSAAGPVAPAGRP